MKKFIFSLIVFVSILGFSHNAFASETYTVLNSNGSVTSTLTYNTITQKWCSPSIFGDGLICITPGQTLNVGDNTNVNFDYYEGYPGSWWNLVHSSWYQYNINYDSGVPIKTLHVISVENNILTWSCTSDVSLVNRSVLYNPDGTIGYYGSFPCWGITPDVYSLNLNLYTQTGTYTLAETDASQGDYVYPTLSQLESSAIYKKKVTFDFIAPILGCMDSTAMNYNPNATQNNYDCTYYTPDYSNSGLRINPTISSDGTVDRNTLPNYGCSIQHGNTTFEPPIGEVSAYVLYKGEYPDKRNIVSGGAIIPDSNGSTVIHDSGIDNCQLISQLENWNIYNAVYFNTSTHFGDQNLGNGTYWIGLGYDFGENGSALNTKNKLGFQFTFIDGVFNLNSGFNPSETCSDGIQNQNETGIDTGGVCSNTENNNSGLTFDNPVSNGVYGNSVTFSGSYVNIHNYDNIIIVLSDPSTNILTYKISIPRSYTPFGKFNISKSSLPSGNYHLVARMWDSVTDSFSEWYPSNNENDNSISFLVGSVDSTNSSDYWSNNSTSWLSTLPKLSDFDCSITSLMDCIKYAGVWLFLPDEQSVAKLQTISFNSQNNILFLPFTFMTMMSNASASHATAFIKIPFAGEVPLFNSSMSVPQVYDDLGATMLWSVFIALWGWFFIRKIFF